MISIPNTKRSRAAQVSGAFGGRRIQPADRRLPPYRRGSAHGGNGARAAGARCDASVGSSRGVPIGSVPSQVEAPGWTDSQLSDADGDAR